MHVAYIYMNVYRTFIKFHVWFWIIFSVGSHFDNTRTWFKDQDSTGAPAVFRRRQQTALSASAVDVHVWKQVRVSTYVYRAFALYGFMKEWVLFKILCRGAEAFLTFISAIIMYTLILQRCWKRCVSWYSKKRRHVPRCSTAPCCSIVFRMFTYSIIWYLESVIPFFSYDGENKENTLTTCTQDDKTLSIFVLYIYTLNLCALLQIRKVSGQFNFVGWSPLWIP